MSGETMSAANAASELGITRQTLYAYVSRGLLHSAGGDSGRRTRRYSVEDVRRLKERQENRRDPRRVLDTALDWGAPIRGSALTLIDSGRYFYRGRNAVELAGALTVEQAAALLWLDSEHEADALFSEEPAMTVDLKAMRSLFGTATTIERFQMALPLAASNDAGAFDLRPRYVARTGVRILRMLTRIAACPTDPAAGEGIAETLRQRWLPNSPDAVALLRSALILCADHELNISSFTARCVASAGSSPYAVVGAGLAALQGTKHGGSTERVEALFREAEDPKYAARALVQRVRRGESVPGFGHPLYPDGDPRGRALLSLASDARPDSPGSQLSIALAAEARAVLHEEPNLDFGLCALCAALALPPGSALTLFALGRTIGWIAHAIEEYQADALIRPRARYTGKVPEGVDSDRIG